MKRVARGGVNHLHMRRLAYYAPRFAEAAGASVGAVQAAALLHDSTKEDGRGEGKDLVRDGALEPGGRLPNNTHGGLLSEGYIHGMNNIAEGVRLVRGESRNQPAKAEHVLVSSGVGVPTGAMILGRD